MKNKDGSREHVQKRVLLDNISELYERFIELHPDVKVGLSKFTQFKTKHYLFFHVLCIVIV